MSLSLTDFWKLTIGSGLVTKDTAKQLHAKYSEVRGASKQGNSRTLAEWLISEGAITRYQAGFLLAGHPGPFVFGDFVVTARIEGGRLADLFQARHIASGQPVLLYFLGAQATSDPRAWAEIQRQAQAAKAMAHPHLCRVLELVDLSTYKFVVLEPLDGVSLAEARGAAPVPAAEACRVVFQTAQGLAMLHAHGAAHGEVRPQNIWRQRNGEIKVLGFPLARDPLAPRELNLSTPEAAAHQAQALEYAAPELAQPGTTPDALTDVYSLGCTFFELLTGNVPFPGGDPAQKMMRHASEGIAPLDRTPGVSPNLAQLVSYMMAKNARIRIANAKAVGEALAALANQSHHAPRAAQPQMVAPMAVRPGMAQPVNVAPVSVAPRMVAPVAMAPPAAAPPAAPLPDYTEPEPLPDYAAAAAPDYSAADVAVADHGRPAPIKHAARRTTTRGSSKKAPEKKKINTNLIIIGAVAGVIVFGGALFMVFRQRGGNDQLATNVPKPTSPDDLKKPEPEEKETPKDEKPPEPPPPTVRTIDDDQKTLWLSPTEGPPLDLHYLPAGGQAILALRPRDLLAHAEGPKVIAALGPGGQYAIDRLEAMLGVKFKDIEQVIICYSHSDGGDFPQTSLVVHMAANFKKDALLEAWKNPGLRGDGDKIYYASGELAYFIPTGQSRMFVVSSPKRMQDEILTSEGPPLLSKDMEKLLRDSDATRHVTLVLTPSFLHADGKALMSGNLERLREPLLSFVGNVQASLFSAHWSESFYTEFRAASKLDQDPEQTAKHYLEDVPKLYTKINEYLFSLSLGDFDKKVLMNLPTMLGVVSKYIRSGDSNGQAMLNCFLPVEAGHNLTLAMDLALLEKPGVKLVAGAAAAKPTANAEPAGEKPATVAAALEKKVSLSFPRDTLEKSMEMLSKEIDTEIVIIGGDLQLDGITKNQSFGLDERDKPAGDILRAIMKLANTDGKLIYVIKPKPEGGKDIIFVTTRAAAEKRGDKLPPELEVKAAPKKK